MLLEELFNCKELWEFIKCRNVAESYLTVKSCGNLSNVGMLLEFYYMIS